jgi:Tfp pilus assembly protein PilX
MPSLCPGRVARSLSRLRSRDRQKSRGAALLLVLIVVPALSIVGVSLLSLATLEGGRARAQQQIAQSLYSAEGGVARGMWVLKTTGQLSNVGQQLPGGVSASSVNQGGLSSGAVNWNGGNITLSASGASGPSPAPFNASSTLPPTC